VSNTNVKTKEIDIKKTDDSRSMKHDTFTVMVNKFGVFFMIILLCILGMIINERFATIGNIINILDGAAYIGIVSAGVAFVIYCGQYGDLSVPAIMAFAGIIAIEFLRFGIVPAIVGGILAGALIGLVNGYIIGKLRVNAIIWTLAMKFMLQGTIRGVYQKTQMYPDVANADSFNKGFFLPLMAKLTPSIVDKDMTANAEQFFALSRTFITLKAPFVSTLKVYPDGTARFGLPMMIVMMIIIMTIFYFIMKKTTFGNQLKIVGSNSLAASMTGINTTKIVALAFVTSAVAASIGGIFYTSLARVGIYSNGAGFDFKAVTAIILGGMSLSGGRGSILGVFGGVLTLGIISNILTLLGMGTFEQQMVSGFIFIVVVAVNSNSLRKLGQDDA